MRARLRALDEARGGTLLVYRAGRMSVYGASLERACPGSMARPESAPDASLAALRALRAELAEIREWCEQQDEWRESATREIRNVVGR